MLLVDHLVSLPGRMLSGMVQVRRIIQASEMRKFEMKRFPTLKMLASAFSL